MKRYAVLTISVLCVLVLCCGCSNSTADNRISKPGAYDGYGAAIYAEGYEMTSQYIQVSDGARLAMDLYRPKDKATGAVQSHNVQGQLRASLRNLQDVPPTTILGCPGTASVRRT